MANSSGFTVRTKTGIYPFMVYDNTLRVLFGTKEVIVTKLEGVFPGSRMKVTGRDLNIYNQVNSGEFFFTTSEVISIE